MYRDYPKAAAPTRGSTSVDDGAAREVDDGAGHGAGVVRRDESGGVGDLGEAGESAQ